MTAYLHKPILKARFLLACSLRPRPHEYVFIWKRIFIDAFSPSVHTKTMKRCDRFHWKRRFFRTVPKVEVYQNTLRKISFQMKMYSCGRVTSKTLEWCQSRTCHMASVPVHIEEWFNLAHAQCLAVAFSKRFGVLVWTDENYIKTVVWTIHCEWNIDIASRSKLRQQSWLGKLVKNLKNIR